MNPRCSLKRVLKRIVAWVPMYACYYTGELAFQILDRWPDGWGDDDGGVVDRLGSLLYRIYSRCMCASCDINDWAGFKLWYVDEAEKAKHG